MATRNSKFLNSFAVFTAFSLANALILGCSDEDDPSGDGSGASAGSGGSPAGSGGSPVGSGGSPAGSGGSSGGLGTSGGSGGSAGTPSGGSGGATASSASLRVVHAAPGAPAVDLYAKGSNQPFAEALAYGKSTGYVELPPGSYQVEVRAAGAAASSAAAYTTPPVAVASGKSYTAIAAGSLASTAAEDAFRVLALEEGFGAAAPASVRVRVVHAGFDAPTVDLNVGNDGGTPELAGLARFADTGAAGVDLTADTALQLGIEAGGDVVTAFTTPKLPAAAELFVIATGELGLQARNELGFALLAVLPDSSTAWIRQNPRVAALHASPDAGPVDIFAGTSEVVDSATFGDLAALQVPPGKIRLDFFPAQMGATARPTAGPAASAETPELEPGETYLAIAAGELAANPSSFTLLALKEEFADNTPDKALVRVVHASADAPSVDLGAVSSPGNIVTPSILGNLTFGDVSGGDGLAVGAGALRLGLSAAGTTATAAEFPLTLAANQRLFAVAAGAFSGGTNSFRLLIVDATSLPWQVAEVEPE